MDWKQICNNFTKRFILQSEIPNEEKEGQDERMKDDEEITQLDIFNEENEEVLEAFKKLQQQYHKLIENASTEIEEIVIYEKFVKDLCDIFNKLIFHLNCKDRKIATLSSNLLEILSKYEEKEEEESLINMNDSDKLIIREVSDNKNETISKPDDLRHQHQNLKNNDLQSTCQKQSPPQLEKLMNETIDEEYKIIKKHESFINKLHIDTARENDMKNFIAKLEEQNTRLENEKKGLIEKNIKYEKKIKDYKQKYNNVQKCNMSDMEALVMEITDKHDQISNLRSKIRKLEEKLEQYERKVQFREKIIRELRRSKSQQQNQSPLMMTPPRTPELLKTSRSSADLIENNLLYRNNQLTVPTHNMNNIGASFYSLSDIDQESTVGKSMSDVNFDCFDDANKDEIERLHQTINEIESENSCNRLLITKLEDELVMIRKCETRNKQDRNIKTDKLNVLRHKIHTVGSKALEKNSEEIVNLKLHHNDRTMIEDELKPEFDVLNNLIKSIDKTKSSLETISNENNEMKSVIDTLKSKLLESQENNQNIVQMICSNFPVDNEKETTKCVTIKKCGNVNMNEHIARILSHLLGKEISSQAIGELSSSISPEISSGNSSLSNGDSALSDVINDWKHELEEKKCELRHKNSTINDLEERLREKEEEICEAKNDFKSIQIERDKYSQMVNQLKNAIQYHNDSIQYLKRQNAELKEEVDDTRNKLATRQDYDDEMKKRNVELEGENDNLRITITNMRSTIEDLKKGNSMQHSNDIETINLLSDQLLKETIQKDEQLNRLREANLELRSKIFELNQDVLDLLEIVEIQKKRRMLEDFKIAQKEQHQQIEKEISNREKDINCLKHYRGRCVEIESEYLEKMASQKLKSDTTIKELENEITALTDQLIQTHQQNSHYDELMKQTAVLQNSMQDLESQNDMLRRTIESYESRFGELQINLEKIQFENGNLIMEIDNLKSDINDKNKRISEMSLDQQRLETDYEMQKKSCSCSPTKNSPTRTSSSVMQINDLKTKLMNKSLEGSKATEALKRKTQQYEKLQKSAFEEKSKLREECLKSIQTIGELKSKISLLEMRVKEQNDEVLTSREKVNQTISKLSAIESELSSKSAKLEDLETREEKWRVHAYEITHEIKNRKEDAFKREQKLLDDLASKDNLLKDQTRVILQHENSLHHLRNENESLKESNKSLNQRLNELKVEINELKSKEAGLSELLKKTEEELKMIKNEVFQLFNTNTVSDIKDVHGQMKNESTNLQTKYQNLMLDYNKLVEETHTLHEIKNDTISAIEIFKKLQSECDQREKSYQTQIAKLQIDKRNLHKDRTRLTKQLLGKHRDMIILNSEIDKFRHPEDYESRSTSQYNSLQPFQPVMYPSALSNVSALARSSSNPDFSTDPIAIDAKCLTEKILRVRKFWQQGIQTATTSLVTIPTTQQQSDQQQQPQPIITTQDEES